MCRPASFIIADRNLKAFWSKLTNSHHEIRAEHKLPDNTPQRTYNVAVEVRPENGDLSTPISKWKFNVDQDRLPSWWDAAAAEKTARRALKDWAKSWVVKTKIKTIAKNRHVFLVAGGTIECFAGGTIKRFHGGTIECFAAGTVECFAAGTITTYRKVDTSIITGTTAVLIDRSDDVPVCYVGPQQGARQ